MRKFLLLLALAASSAHAQGSFDSWLAAFRQEAEAQGISAATLDSALTGLQPIERVIELDRRQPELLQTFSDSLARRVTEGRIAQGRLLLQEHAALLDAIEQRFGVPKTVLAAFWGLETNFGATLGNYNVPASLATLAYDGRRSLFFRNQLIDALRVIDAGHVHAIDMNGSWAGAMGHMQFMPSTFLAYALDGDGDGRIDVWKSLPDAMHSAGNYLKRAGWRAGEPVALEVCLPAGFDWRLTGLSERRPVAEWIALGVLKPDGGALPATAGQAAIALPQGWEGPAFMVFDNLDVVMRWNRSLSYALAVAQLANRLAGGAPLTARSGEAGAVSVAQLKALQQSLTALGFDTGAPDGQLGPRTQNAIRQYQSRYQLPVDGYAGPGLVRHVEQTRAAAQAAGRLEPAPTFSDFDDAP